MAIRPDETWRMQEFGIAYVQAVASAVGCKLDRPQVDDDSIDLSLSMKTTTSRVRSPKVEAQLKTTHQDLLSDDHLAYPLKIKNYDELRPINYSVPRILIVVVVPDDVQNWICQNESELILRRCGYWATLYGAPAVENVASKTVEIPRKNVLDVDALSSMFERLGNGRLP